MHNFNKKSCVSKILFLLFLKIYLYHHGNKFLEIKKKNQKSFCSVLSKVYEYLHFIYHIHREKYYKNEKSNIYT